MLKKLADLHAEHRQTLAEIITYENVFEHLFCCFCCCCRLERNKKIDFFHF